MLGWPLNRCLAGAGIDQLIQNDGNLDKVNASQVATSAVAGASGPLLEKLVYLSPLMRNSTKVHGIHQSAFVSNTSIPANSSLAVMTIEAGIVMSTVLEESMLNNKTTSEDTEDSSSSSGSGSSNSNSYSGSYDMSQRGYDRSNTRKKNNYTPQTETNKGRKAGEKVLDGKREN